MGRSWASATDRNGRRRLDNPDDLVRLELELALNGGKKIVPVLVQGAEMPGADELPPSLSRFVRRHAFDVADRRWRSDLAELISALEELAQQPPRAQKPKTPAIEEQSRRQAEEALPGRHEPQLHDFKQDVQVPSEADDTRERQLRNAFELPSSRTLQRQKGLEEVRPAIAPPEPGPSDDLLNLAVTFRSSRPIRAVAFHPNGRMLASAGADGTVRLWDAIEGTELGILTGHTNDVRAVAFGPAGRTVASAGWDGTVRLWDVATGGELRTFSSDRVPKVSSLAFAATGRLLAAAGSRTVQVWDVQSGAILQTITVDHPVNGLAFKPDGRTLAAAYSHVAQQWDAETGANLGVLSGHGDKIVALAYAPSGQVLASAAWDGTVRLWDTTDGVGVRILNGHGTKMSALAFTSDGAVLAAADAHSGLVQMWDSVTWDVLKPSQGVSGSVVDIAFAPNWQMTLRSGRIARRIAVVSSNKYIAHVQWPMVGQGASLP